MLNPPIDRSDDDRVGGLPLTAWVQIVTVGLLMIGLFRFNLVRLWGKTNPIDGQDPNWQHSIFVPLIGIYYLFIHREELLRAAAMPRVRERAIRILSIVGLALMAVAGAALLQKGEHGTPLLLVGILAAGLLVPAIVPTSAAFGSVLMLEGLLVFAYGIFPGQNDYVKDLGMVITLFGVTTLLAGWPVMRIAWFPIVFLVVALPWPELVYSTLASPLQQLAASAAVGTLRLFGVTAHNFGTKIEMFDKSGMPRVLNVAEACAGLKSVMTFLMVAATVAFLSQRPLWEKLVITLSAIPIAIFCNVARVCGMGLLDRYVSRDWSEGFAHQFAGLVMVIPGFFVILLVGWLLDQMFIEEVEGAPATAGNGGTASAAGAAVAVNRSKRLVVEVPRKKPAEAVAASAPSPNTSDEKMPVATPGVPVSAPAPAAAAAPAVAPHTVTPAAASKPAPATPAVTLRQSTLKAPPAAAARPTGNAPPAPAAGSTLKPPSKPAAAPRGTTSPAQPQGGLRPSTLKPSAPKPAAGTPGAAPAARHPQQPQQPPVARPKPAVSPNPQPQPAPPKQQTQGIKPPVARPPQAPPQQKPQQPKQQQGDQPKSE